MILLIDNYDSFSYNLYQLIGSVNAKEASLNEINNPAASSGVCCSHKELHSEFNTFLTAPRGGVLNPSARIKVVRNDEINIEDIKKLNPSRIVISPGPGKPSGAGICIEVIKQLHSNFPILGICLGHQAIFEAFGGTVSYAKNLMHGKSSQVTVDNNSYLFKGLAQVIQAARYHSLAGTASTLPSCLQVTAKTDDSEIMAVQHRDFPVYGLQFHPESILTPCGDIIIRNFLGYEK